MNRRAFQHSNRPFVVRECRFELGKTARVVDAVSFASRIPRLPVSLARRTPPPRGLATPRSRASPAPWSRRVRVAPRRDTPPRVGASPRARSRSSSRSTARTATPTPPRRRAGRTSTRRRPSRRARRTDSGGSRPTARARPWCATPRGEERTPPTPPTPRARRRSSLVSPARAAVGRAEKKRQRTDSFETTHIFHPRDAPD